jgi:hypothetical protein
MAFEEGTGSSMYMPVAPAYGGGGGFMGGNDGWWIILLLLACGGWGGGFGGGWGGGMGGMFFDYPWIADGQQQIMASTSNGFRDSMLNDSINGIQTQLYTNQISDLERSFAAQTAVTSGMTNLSSQLATCCCENRLATCQTQNIVQAEGAATRASASADTQRILDKLCQLELDAKNDTIGQLRQELLYARGQASQVSQTAAIEASQAAQTQYIVNRVAPYPIPAYVVANPVTPAAAAIVA